MCPSGLCPHCRHCHGGAGHTCAPCSHTARRPHCEASGGAQVAAIATAGKPSSSPAAQTQVDVVPKLHVLELTLRRQCFTPARRPARRCVFLGGFSQQTDGDTTASQSRRIGRGSWHCAAANLEGTLESPACCSAEAGRQTRHHLIQECGMVLCSPVLLEAVLPDEQEHLQLWSLGWHRSVISLRAQT